MYILLKFIKVKGVLVTKTNKSVEFNCNKGKSAYVSNLFIFRRNFLMLISFPILQKKRNDIHWYLQNIHSILEVSNDLQMQRYIKKSLC